MNLARGIQLQLSHDIGHLHQVPGARPAPNDYGGSFAREAQSSL
jgi:hypothetical protein